MVTTVFVFNIQGQMIAEYTTGSPSGTLGTSYLTSDTLGSPRVITGSGQQVKGRHDYLPFGEELFSGLGGRTTGQGYGIADDIRQQFTQKERDIETGLDYFGARYYASTQGRFTGADRYDINFERQETADREEADALFREYIGQPQHWNHYSYALNNPLRYVDPDGLFEYETDLLGKKIKVNISDRIDKKAQENIKRNIDSAIAKINAGKEKLTDKQISAINSVKGIEVKTNGNRIGMNNGTFQITQRYAEERPNGLSLDFLTGAIVHDSFHADQEKRGLSFEGDKANLAREREASAFAADVAERLGLDNRVVEWLKRDAITGHLAEPLRSKSRPPKKKTP